MSRVLVVEDEAHLAKGLRFNLEAEGHSVEVSGDGESALERLVAKNEDFDVVVLDVMLPGKDGFTVVSALRKARNYVPVLILTARGRPEDVLARLCSRRGRLSAKTFSVADISRQAAGLAAPQPVADRREAGNKGPRGQREGRHRELPAAPRIPRPMPKYFRSTARPSISERWNFASTAPPSSSRSWKRSSCVT